MTRRDWIGAAAVLLWLAALVAYRRTAIEPRAWGALCAAAAPPLACLPRAGFLWMQQTYLWGAAALALGGIALRGAAFPVAVAAVAAGVAAVVNYNATWGMLGAALGAWAWIVRARRPMP